MAPRYITLEVHDSVDTTLNTKGVYDPLYSAFHPMNYLESDAMWYNRHYSLTLLPIFE